MLFNKLMLLLQYILADKIIILAAFQVVDFATMQEDICSLVRAVST